MREGKIVILVFLAPDESESSQRIGMRNTRHDEKPWEQGPRRRATMITQLRIIPGYHTGFLCEGTKRLKKTWKKVRGKVW